MLSENWITFSLFLPRYIVLSFLFDSLQIRYWRPGERWGERVAVRKKYVVFPIFSFSVFALLIHLSCWIILCFNLQLYFIFLGGLEYFLVLLLHFLNFTISNYYMLRASFLHNICAADCLPCHTSFLKWSHKGILMHLFRAYGGYWHWYIHVSESHVSLSSTYSLNPNGPNGPNQCFSLVTCFKFPEGEYDKNTGWYLRKLGREYVW